MNKFTEQPELLDRDRLPPRDGASRARIGDDDEVVGSGRD